MNGDSLKATCQAYNDPHIETFDGRYEKKKGNLTPQILTVIRNPPEKYFSSYKVGYHLFKAL